MSCRAQLLVACCLLAAGCVEPTFEAVELQRHRTWTAAASCIPDPAKVDVLLVIDDSPSMAEEAAMLGEALLSFGQIYEDPGAALDLPHRGGVHPRLASGL